ncbi:MAG: 50S ribosomal protein L29 [Candidatus Sumerlaeia bacterium]|nr:50S ribosomal protein L29 [Candidatus Sumerlaeia bacterium]
MATAKELRNLSVDELINRSKEIRRTIFNLRVRATTKELKDVSEIKTQKRELARVLTVLREKGVKL